MLATPTILDLRRAEASKRSFRVAAVVAGLFVPVALVLSQPTIAAVANFGLMVFFLAASFLVDAERYRAANRFILVFAQAISIGFAVATPHLGLAVMGLAQAVHALYNEPSRAWRIGLVGSGILLTAWLLDQEASGNSVVVDPSRVDMRLIIHCALSGLLTMGVVYINRNLNLELFRETRQRAEELSARVEAQRAATAALTKKRQSLEEARESSARSIANQTRHQHRLAAAQEQLKQFTYAAGHDLKEPIRTIRSFVELTRGKLPERLATDGRLREHFGFVSASAESMHTVLEKLLNYSRVGNSEVRLIQQSVHALWTGALEEASAKFELGGVSIVTEVPEGLAAKLPLGHAKWLFAEIVSNALTFVDPARPQAISCVAEHVSGGRVRIRIADNGIGIDAAYTEQVFGLFKRLHAREVYPGSGLGLPLVRRTADGAGGSVRLDSELGVGTTIELILPGGVINPLMPELGRAATRN